MSDPWADATEEVGEPTPSVESDAVQRVVACMVELAGVCKALELAAHLVHLNYEGPCFLEVHAFMKGRYETHLAQFDGLTEFVRSLDYLVPMEMTTGLEALPCCMPPTGASGRELMVGYLKNLEEFGLMAKELFRVASAAEAIDVENYAAELVADTYKAAWFVKAQLR